MWLALLRSTKNFLSNSCSGSSFLEATNTCLMNGSEFFATAPMVELSVGTVRQANTDKSSSSASSPNLVSDSWWCSLSRKMIPVAYLPKGGNCTLSASLSEKDRC